MHYRKLYVHRQIAINNLFYAYDRDMRSSNRDWDNEIIWNMQSTSDIYNSGGIFIKLIHITYTYIFLNYLFWCSLVLSFNTIVESAMSSTEILNLESIFFIKILSNKLRVLQKSKYLRTKVKNLKNWITLIRYDVTLNFKKLYPFTSIFLYES